MSTVPSSAELASAKTTPLAPPRNQQDFENLLEKFTPLIFSLARKLTSDYDDLQDLTQEGRIGLYEAFRRYDPERGTELSTYAYAYIRGYMLSWIEKEKKAHHSNISDSDSWDVNTIQLEGNLNEIMELGTSPDNLSSEQEMMIHKLWLKALNALVFKAINELSSKKRQIFRSRFLEGRRPSKIAKDFGISRPRVTQLISSSLSQIEPMLEGLS